MRVTCYTVVIIIVPPLPSPFIAGGGGGGGPAVTRLNLKTYTKMHEKYKLYIFVAVLSAAA